MNIPKEYPWIHPSRLDRVVDSDTLRLQVDHGCRIYSKQVIRLAGVNCPEMDTPEGKAATAAVIATVGASPMIVQTIQDRADPYGRFLGIVYIQQTVRPSLLNLNRWLLDEGLAVPSGAYAKLVAAMPLRTELESIKAIKEP